MLETGHSSIITEVLSISRRAINLSRNVNYLERIHLLDPLNGLHHIVYMLKINHAVTKFVQPTITLLDILYSILHIFETLLSCYSMFFFFFFFFFDVMPVLMYTSRHDIQSVGTPPFSSGL